MQLPTDLIRQRVRERLARPCECCDQRLASMNAAASMKLAYPSLRRFLRGGDVQGASLDKMTAWLARWKGHERRKRADT